MTRTSPAGSPGRLTIAAFFPEVETPRPGLTFRLARLEEPTASFALIDLSALATCLAAPDGEKDLGALLSPAEQEHLAALSFPKRRREWLGGRLAGKAAALRLAQPPVPVTLAMLSIPSAASGAPLLTCPSLPAWQLPALSLTHSDRHAVALAAWTCGCGVDLQNVTPQILRVADRFSETAERQRLREALPRMEETERLTLLWTAKEALKKALLSDQPAVFQGVTLEAVREGSTSVLFLRYPGDRGNAASVIVHALEDHFLAYTFGGAHA